MLPNWTDRIWLWSHPRFYTCVTLVTSLGLLLICNRVNVRGLRTIVSYIHFVELWMMTQGARQWRTRCFMFLEVTDPHVSTGWHSLQSLPFCLSPLDLSPLPVPPEFRGRFFKGAKDSWASISQWKSIGAWYLKTNSYLCFRKSPSPQPFASTLNRFHPEICCTYSFCVPHLCSHLILNLSFLTNIHTQSMVFSQSSIAQK